MTFAEGFALESVAAVKQAVDLPVIAFGRIKSPDQAEAILATGQADLVGMARQLITDPHWVNKVAEGRTAEIRPCVACNQECVGRLAQNLPIGCVHNPAAGFEETLGVETLTPAQTPKRVIVIGGGPLGLKAAEVAAMRGHTVTLIEKADELGGQVRFAARAPGHAEWGQIVAHLIDRVQQLGVTVRLNTEATAALIGADNPDAVVVATGSGPGPLPFAAKGSLPVFDEWQVLQDGGPRDQRVVLLDIGVRYEGAALVETLAERGNTVYWLAPTPTVGFHIDPPSLVSLRARLGAMDPPVECVAETTVIESGDDMVLTLNVFSQQVRPLAPVDALVIAGGKMSHSALAEQLESVVPEVYTGGDAVAPRNVSIAIREGERIGRAL
ncbi:MAG: FAD-dependent oxidoreductase [Chloroflexi bacterium]|nr:FAD-dependent oxidoreductase [Chloroflexota bacterium]